MGVGRDDRADTARRRIKSTMTIGIRHHGTRELLALWRNWGKVFAALNQGPHDTEKKKVAPDATQLVFVRLNKGDVS
jgi:hypothetical protein